MQYFQNKHYAYLCNAVLIILMLSLASMFGSWYLHYWGAWFVPQDNAKLDQLLDQGDALGTADVVAKNLFGVPKQAKSLVQQLSPLPLPPLVIDITGIIYAPNVNQSHLLFTDRSNNSLIAQPGDYIDGNYKINLILPEGIYVEHAGRLRWLASPTNEPVITLASSVSASSNRSLVLTEIRVDQRLIGCALVYPYESNDVNLLSGDVIQAINGALVTSSTCKKNDSLLPESSNTLQLLRDGKSITVDVHHEH